MRVIYDDDWFDEQDIIAIRPDGEILHMLRLTGHDESELTGPAFSPDGQHFFFNSQRGTDASGPAQGGVTFRVSGNWFA